MTDMKLNGCIIMGPDGDCEISWTEDQNARMLEFIRDRMAKGWMFFLIDEKETNIKWTPLSDPTDAKSTRRVSMVDPIVTSATAAGAKVSKGGVTGDAISTKGRAATAEEVVANDTIGFRAAKGG